MMSDTDIVIEVAKLDGYTEEQAHSFGNSVEKEFAYQCGEINSEEYVSNVVQQPKPPNYLHSRDAIIPVIKKQTQHVQLGVVDELTPHKREFDGDVAVIAMTAPARQLCIALLKATGRWKE